MIPKLQAAFNAELKLAQTARTGGDLSCAFHHLERAHVLGQRSFSAHLTTHRLMLRIGIARKDTREIIGQIIRIIAVFPAAIFGWLPMGNTGGANISALKPMPIPEDLAALFIDD